MQTGAVVAVTVQGADQGETTTIHATLERAKTGLTEAAQDEAARRKMKPTRGIVADKGFHSNETIRDLQTVHHLKPCINEPNRSRRKWKGKPSEQRAVYGNRRIKADRGKRLMRKRGELLERGSAHLYETGAMRRTHLRGHDNILKRLVIHAAGFNLSLILRRTIGIGKARCPQDHPGAVLRRVPSLLRRLISGFGRRASPNSTIAIQYHDIHTKTSPDKAMTRDHAHATGC